LGPEVSDMDGNTEEPKGTISTFNGPQPDIMVLETPEAEIKAVSRWLTERTNEGIVPHEIGVFVRSAAELSRARSAVENAKLPYKVLDDNVETTTGRASISTIWRACSWDAAVPHERSSSVARRWPSRYCRSIASV